MKPSQAFVFVTSKAAVDRRWNRHGFRIEIPTRRSRLASRLWSLEIGGDDVAYWACLPLAATINADRGRCLSRHAPATRADAASAGPDHAEATPEWPLVGALVDRTAALALPTGDSIVTAFGNLPAA